MLEVIFLIVLSTAWLIFATVQDLKYKEIANWLNFSLIIFALGFRFFWSLFGGDFTFLYQGLIGFGIFFILGNFLYYCKMFAGGDAKLFISLGAILPFSNILQINIINSFWWFFIFLCVGAFYGLIISFVLMVKNFKGFKKEFYKLIRKNKLILNIILIIAIAFLILGFINNIFLIGGILFVVFPYYYFYAKAVDECCMIRKTNVKDLVEGDWLYKDIKIGGKKIKASWNGLSKSEIKIIQRKKKYIVLRYGIAFAPVFLISFLIFCGLYFVGFF